jgi:lipopolysaccharide/colanic/teichoic acid biosynthesis glycosyltransferase
VSVYPLLIDARPEYLGGNGNTLLLFPMGPGSLGGHLCSQLQTVTQQRPLVMAPPDSASDYREEIRGATPDARVVSDVDELQDALAELDPSDEVLVVDPRCFPADGFDPQALLARRDSDPRWVMHLVAFEEGRKGGTKEYAWLDGEGRVRTVQRYYDQVTWPFITGVAASLMPASVLRGQELPTTPLAELRSRLAARGIPSRDLPLSGNAFDLGDEAGLLALSERFVLKATSSRGRMDPLLVGNGQVVHMSSRLVGPVIVHPGVVIEENATVLGPALLGAGARIGAGAIVAQSVVGPGCVVPPGDRVRHRAVLPGRNGNGAAAPPGLMPIPLPLTHLSADDSHAEPTPRARYMRVKRVLESAAAAAALVLLAPLMALLALLVALDSRGPVFYGHDREGLRGRRFRCLKFRTMYVGAQERERELRAQSQVDGPQFKIDRDPRTTPVGRLLRATSLDELPQLFNVVRGEMALVGPRPSPFRENQLCVDWRTGRLSVRPGITGLWQVCRHDRSEGDFHQWIEYDLLYVRYMSPGLDLRILFATLLTLGGRRSVPVSWLLGQS